MGELPQPLPFKPAELVLPPIHERRLDNGLQIVVAEKRNVPLVSINLLLRTGAARERRAKAGLADFVVELLRRGTEKYSAEVLDERLELIGADLRLETGNDSTWLGSTAPSEHLPLLLDLLAEVAIRPTFPAKEVAQSRKRNEARILSELDNPSGLAGDALGRLAFGRHPYGFPASGTVAATRSFSRKDCLEFFRTWYVPSNAILVVVGDVDVQDVFRQAKKHFGSWKGPSLEVAPLSPVDPPPAGKIVLVDKPEQTQTQIRIASRGPDRRYERLIPARLSTQIFGGGFTSRLMDEIRVNRGLTYGISASLYEAEAGGLTVVSSFTRNESTRELIEAVFSLAEQYREEGPTEEELVRGKRYAIGLFPLSVETVEHLARAFGDMARYGRSREWIERYREHMLEVTTEQAREEARRFLLADGVCMALVGDASAIRKELKGLGEVQVVPVRKLA